MSNTNSIQYFASQAYRQVQLSIEKGKEPYAYSDFNKQFMALYEASGDEEYTKKLVIMLVEETVRLKQTTDYLRQEMAFEVNSSSTGGFTKSAEFFSFDSGIKNGVDLSVQRIGRHRR